ncbi:MAG: GntR family transcriptional regulator [Nocardioides sp.]|uniref:GntR family transcriptional regulator n=1 Tax=Nocardioides sp. TaxID=35761 RepID=UPI0039E6C95C
MPTQARNAAGKELDDLTDRSPDPRGAIDRGPIDRGRRRPTASVDRPHRRRELTTMQGARRRSIFTARLVNSAGAGEQPRVIEDLRRAILGGDEPPGTLIPIEAVASFFGVSQIPVREALKTLHGEGLVDHVPHVGYSVAKVTFSEFRELYDVRAALEAAALRAAVPRATTEDDDRARRSHAALARAVAERDERGYHAESRHFHMHLIAPAGMERLLHMYEGAWNITEPARPMSRVSTQGRQMFHDDHDRMLDSFMARDADRLVVESARHYEHLKRAIATFRDDPEVFRQPGS